MAAPVAPSHYVAPHLRYKAGLPSNPQLKTQAHAVASPDNETSPAQGRRVVTVTSYAQVVSRPTPGQKANTSAPSTYAQAADARTQASKATQPASKAEQSAPQTKQSAPETKQSKPEAKQPGPGPSQSPPQVVQPASQLGQSALKADQANRKADEASPKPDEPSPKPDQPVPKPPRVVLQTPRPATPPKSKQSIPDESPVSNGAQISQASQLPTSSSPHDKAACSRNTPATSPNSSKKTDAHGEVEGWQTQRKKGRRDSVHGQPAKSVEHTKPPKKLSMREAMKMSRPEKAPRAPREKSPDSNAWGSCKCGGGGCSACNDNGWGKSEADPSGLLQWDGQLLPPPVEGRTHYTGDANKMVDRWLDVAVKEWPNNFPVVDVSEATKFTLPEGPDTHLEILGDVVPRYWQLKTVEGQSAQAYWDETYIDFIMDGDREAEPFWRLWVSKTHDLQRRITVPDAKVDHEDMGFNACNKDKGSQAAMHAEMQRRAKHSQRTRRVRASEHRASSRVPIPPPNQNRPRIDMYIRCVDLAAGSDDLNQITDIYNRYIRNSVHATESEALTLDQMHRKLAYALEVRMPVLVAVAKKTQRWTPRTGKIKRPYTILGFAYADESGPRQTMYEFSTELEFFVSQDYLRQGVAKNLLDRMLFCIDRDYEVKGGCDFHSEGSDFEFSGGRRLIRNIVCYPLYPSDEPGRLLWTGGLLERFGFEKVGNIPDMGVKLGRNVSIGVYIYKTARPIDPVNPYH